MRSGLHCFFSARFQNMSSVRTWLTRTLRRQKHRQNGRLRDPNPTKDIPDKDSAKSPKTNKLCYFSYPRNPGIIQLISSYSHQSLHGPIWARAPARNLASGWGITGGRLPGRQSYGVLVGIGVVGWWRAWRGYCAKIYELPKPETLNPKAYCAKLDALPVYGWRTKLSNF